MALLAKLHKLKDFLALACGKAADLHIRWFNVLLQSGHKECTTKCHRTLMQRSFFDVSHLFDMAKPMDTAITIIAGSSLFSHH